MDFDDSIPLEIPLNTGSDGDEDSLNDRLSLFAEYVDVTRFFPEEDLSA